MKIIFFLFALSSMSFANEIDTRFYYCKGNNVELSFFQILGKQKQNFFEMQVLNNALRKFDKVLVKNHRRHIEMIVVDESTSEKFTMRFNKPKESPNIKRANGAIDYQQSFDTKLHVKNTSGRSSHHVNCRVFGLHERFFNHIASVIP